MKFSAPFIATIMASSANKFATATAGGVASAESASVSAKSGKNSKSMNCAETMTYYFNSGAAASNSVKAPSGVTTPECGQVPAFPTVDVCVGETFITQPTFLFTSPEDASSNSKVDAVGMLTSTQMIVGVLEDDGRILSKQDGAFVFFGEGSLIGAEILTSDLETLFDGSITSAIVGGTGPYAGIQGNVYITPGTPAAGTTEVVFCVL